MARLLVYRDGDGIVSERERESLQRCRGSDHRGGTTTPDECSDEGKVHTYID